MSLLDKAKKVNQNRRHGRIYSEEEIELAEAWVNDEVTISQLAQALGYPKTQSSNAYSFAALALKQKINFTKIKNS